MLDSPSIIIVNDQDEIIGHTPRDLKKPHERHRVSALWLTNSRGDILLAQRKFTKKFSPGKWGPAVAGTNEQGETYYTNIIKETAEEIGLIAAELTPGPKQLMRHKREYFCQWYTLTLDWSAEQFTPQAEEVEQVKWVTPQELEAQLREHPEQFTPAMPWALANLSGVKRNT